MWICSRETSDAWVYKADIEREPHLYPKEVVEALGKIEELDAKDLGYTTESPEFRFAFEGYEINKYGVVGLRPDASELAKKEWMSHWRAMKAAPDVIF